MKGHWFKLKHNTNLLENNTSCLAPLLMVPPIKSNLSGFPLVVFSSDDQLGRGQTERGLNRYLYLQHENYLWREMEGKSDHLPHCQSPCARRNQSPVVFHRVCTPRNNNHTSPWVHPESRACWEANNWPQHMCTTSAFVQGEWAFAWAWFAWASSSKEGFTCICS